MQLEEPVRSGYRFRRYDIGDAQIDLPERVDRYEVVSLRPGSLRPGRIGFTGIRLPFTRDDGLAQLFNLLGDHIVIDLVKQDFDFAYGASGQRRVYLDLVPILLLHAPFQAHHFPQSLGAERHDGRHHKGQDPDRLRAHVERGSASHPVGFARVPGRLVVEVPVASVAEGDQFPDGTPYLEGFEALADTARGSGDGIQHGPVLRRKRPRLRDHPVEIPVDESQRAVYEIPENVGQFIVVPRLEVLPGKIGVLRFGRNRREAVPHRIGRENLQVFVQPDRPVPARGQLLALDIEKLVGRNLGGQDEIPVFHDHGRPQNRVKDDVVLAEEIDELAVRIQPVVLPPVGIALRHRPFPGGRHVTQRVFEPDVHDLAHGVFHRQRHAPVQVARDGAVGEPLVEPAPAIVAYVVLPVLFRLDPRLQPGRNAGELEIPVIDRPDLERTFTEFAVRINQLRGVENGAAGLALVPPGAVRSAVGARAFHVTIGQEAVAGRTVDLVDFPHVEAALLFQAADVGPGRFVVDGPGGLGEIVVDDAEVFEGTLDDGIVLVHEFLGRCAFLLGRQGDGHAVIVRSADVNDVPAFQPLVADIDVPWQMDAGDMADVQFAVRVGQRVGYEYFLRHGFLMDTGGQSLHETRSMPASR